MKKHILTASLLVSIIALGSVTYKQKGQVTGLKEQVKEKESVAELSRSNCKTGKCMSSVRIKDLERELEVTVDRFEKEKELNVKLAKKIESVQKVAKSNSAKQAKRSAKRSESPMEGMAEVMKNPAMREMIEAQQKAAIDVSHGQLYEYLDLSAEELESFKQMLLDKQMSMVDDGLKMLGGNLSEEERSQIAASIAEKTKMYNDEIKELLGEEDYEVYEQFEQTQSERMQVNMIKQQLTGDSSITEDQEDKLIRAMHEERTNFKYSTDFQDQSNNDPSKLTTEVVETYIAETKRLNELTAKRAQEILSDEQMKAFIAGQEQFLSLQEMGMKMSAQMFSKPEEEPAGEPIVDSKEDEEFYDDE